MCPTERETERERQREREQFLNMTNKLIVKWTCSIIRMGMVRS